MTFLEDALPVAFVILAGAAAWQWHKRRSAPGRYLTLAFVSLVLVLLAGRFDLGGDEGLDLAISIGIVTALATFPWLLAAFAWSFEGRLPGWLRLAAVAVVGLAAWGATLVPFPEPVDRELQHEIYLLAFIASWGVLTVASATRLWTAGGRQRLVRARMRLMAGGMLSLTIALFLAVGGAGSQEGDVLQVLTQLLVLSSAGLFLAGFAPPLPLRLWWRRRATQQFQQMQVSLIAAATPREVGVAVVPTLADLIGSGVVLVGPDRQVLASAQMADAEARLLARRISAGGTLDDDTLVVPVNSSWLLIRTNPYTPVFGQDEQELVAAFSLQVRMALERSELFEAHLAARADAERSNKELEAMIFGLSHDLRSPAIAISGFAALLAETEEPTARSEMIERIQASTSYLNGLVDALLELSRIGRAQSNVEPVDLATVARLVGQRLEANHRSVTVAVEGELPVVLLNPARAEQLMDNLVGNAVKHGGREDLTVTISSRTTPDGVDLIVADDGQGVREDDREVIFALFQRGTNAGGRGSGLGLGMVRRIAETSGGSVRLEPSEQGATFVVSLPSEAVVEPRDAQPV